MLWLWDQEALRERIRGRLDQLGEPPATLLRRIGAPADDIRKLLNEETKSPGINVMLRVAKALGWTMGQMLGTQDPLLNMSQGEREIDPRKLLWALNLVDEFYITARGTDSHYIEKDLGYADALSLAYQILSEEELEGRSPDPEQNPTLRSALRTLLRQL